MENGDFALLFHLENSPSWRFPRRPFLLLNKPCSSHGRSSAPVNRRCATLLSESMGDSAH